MRSRTPLVLMEQLVMVMVFALAAVLCLQVFVLSDRMSRRCEERDRAVTEVQNAAEILKSYRGNLEECARILEGTGRDGQLCLSYDTEWNQVSSERAAYQVLITPLKTEDLLLGTVKVSAQTMEGETLFQVSVSWQEVGFHG